MDSPRPLRELGLGLCTARILGGRTMWVGSAEAQNSTRGSMGRDAKSCHHVRRRISTLHRQGTHRHAKKVASRATSQRCWLGREPHNSPSKQKRRVRNLATVSGTMLCSIMPEALQDRA
jgi:hypothetical protein